MIIFQNEFDKFLYGFETFLSLFLIYMNYQSLLSSILDNKYYNLQEISELRQTIQRNSGLKIVSIKHTSGQIIIECPNKNQYRCGFSYVFRNVILEKDLHKFELSKSSQNHSEECLSSRRHFVQQELLTFQKFDTKLILKEQISELKYVSQTSASPVSKDNSLTKQKSQNRRFYNEEQFSLLKKDLELMSKGLLSKSTEFENQSAIVKRIKFHCKYQSSCPYQAILVDTQKYDSIGKKMFELTVMHPQHLKECLLDEEILNYNKNTMKIDCELQVLTHLIQSNSDNVKPKDILKMLAQKLNEPENFIYEGLTKKINKRAIKKYFDNCVAKVRSKLNISSPKKSTSSYAEMQGKNGKYTKHQGKNKDEDYLCKSH